MGNHDGIATTADFDRVFDSGAEDITPCLDVSTASRINRATRRVNVDFPAWMVARIDREAGRIGITRQAYIKTVLAERLDALALRA